MSVNCDWRTNKFEIEFSSPCSIYNFYSMLNDHMQCFTSTLNIGVDDQLFHILNLLRLEINKEQNWDPNLILDYENVSRFLIKKYAPKLYSFILSNWSEGDKCVLQDNGIITVFDVV